MKLRKTITKLTDNEKSLMKPFADKWIQDTLAPQGANRERVEKGIVDCYRFAGLEPPKHIVWVKSPTQLVVVGPTIALLIELSKKISTNNDIKNISKTIGKAVFNAVRNTVDNTVDNAVRRAILNIISRSWNNVLGGKYWSGWWWRGTACISFIRDVLGLELSQEIRLKSQAWEDLMSGGWMWLHREFAICAEPHNTISRDTRDRLHSDNGPAISWSDHTGLWFWHGIQIEQYIIENPETITVSKVIEETNAEIRRIMLDRYIGGPGKFLLDAKAQVLDEDQDRHGLRTLFKFDLEGDEPLVMIRVHCVRKDGVIDTYFLRIDPKHTTCKKAIASTFKKQQNNYRPIVES